MDWDTGELGSLAVDLGRAGAQATAKASRAIRKGAFDIEAAAKAIAPVDTGALRASIGVTTSGPLTAAIGPTVDYAAYVEFGTRRMRAQPYMQPAADKVLPSVETALAQLAGDIL